MFLDQDNNVITVTKKINGHSITIGMSGYGKSFCLCRQIEEVCNTGHHITLFDISGSFTDAELNKHGFQPMSYVQRISTEQAILCLGSYFDDWLTAAILEAFGINSYHQKELIKEIIESSNESATFSSLISDLSLMRGKLDCNRQRRENIDNLLGRFGPYEKMHLIFSRQSTEYPDNRIFLYDFEQTELSLRKELARLLISLTWHKARVQKYPSVFVIDELQYIEFAKSSSLEEILREGRKFNVSAFLATQFFEGTYESEGKNLLQQCATKYIFRPTPTDIRQLLELFVSEEKETWKRILQNLPQGYCVLVGECSANASDISFPSAVVVEVVKNM